MSRRPLTDEEEAVVRYIRSDDPPATQPVPPLISEALRRIVESANPVDVLRHEYRAISELTLRYDLEQGLVLEART